MKLTRNCGFLTNPSWYAKCASDTIGSKVFRGSAKRKISAERRQQVASDPSGVLLMRCAANRRYSRQRWPLWIRRDRTRNSNSGAGPWVDRRPRGVTFRGTPRKLSTRVRNRYPAVVDARCIMRAAAAQTQIRIPLWIPAARRKREIGSTEFPPGRRKPMGKNVGQARLTISSFITRCRATSRSPGRRFYDAEASRMSLRCFILRKRIRDRKLCRRSVEELVKTASALPQV